MTLRPPQPHTDKALENPLDYEIAREQAATLGRLGRALEAALAALADFDSAGAEQPESAKAATVRDRPRERLVQEASHALWCFIVQREACGLRDPRPVLREYRVPAEVHNRMGACAGPNLQIRSVYSRTDCNAE